MFIFIQIVPPPVPPPPPPGLSIEHISIYLLLTAVVFGTVLLKKMQS